MSVLFTPFKSKSPILIAGQSALSGAAGVVGPFPNFSIDREDAMTPRGGILMPKFTIRVNGSATIPEADAQDIMIKGERQESVFGQVLTLAQLNRQLVKNYNVGKLELKPYGGRASKIIFEDAKLISVSVPEQPEQSAGVQLTQFSFVFEAYLELDAGGNTSNGKPGAPVMPEFLLSAADESWDITINQDQTFYKDGAFESPTNLRRTYTLTHTVSATGLDKWENGEIQQDGEAFRQAAQWVQLRLEDDPFKKPIEKDLINDPEYFPSTFLAPELNAPNKQEEFKINLTTGDIKYEAYNHVRNINSNFSKGEYSVTETWVLSDSAYKATHQLEANIESDSSQLYNRITINGVFTGLNDELDTSQNKEDKFTNAKESFDAFVSKKVIIAQAFASESNTGFGTVNPIPISETVASNHNAGTISYSAVFDDRVPDIPGAISEDVTIEYGNSNGIVDVYAVFQVLGKSDPVVQLMNCTPLTSVTITVSAQMEKDRGKPDGTLISRAYRSGYDYCKAFSESWNPKTRSYTLTETWEGTAGS